jgi:hypothetical protein
MVDESRLRIAPSSTLKPVTPLSGLSPQLDVSRPLIVNPFILTSASLIISTIYGIPSIPLVRTVGALDILRN